MNKDITYCVSTCTDYDCFRHSSRITINTYASCSNFKDTSICPHYKEKENTKECNSENTK